MSYEIRQAEVARLRRWCTTTRDHLSHEAVGFEIITTLLVKARGTPFSHRVDRQDLSERVLGCKEGDPGYMQKTLIPHVTY